MANFSIGLAKESSRKYVFIKELYKEANLIVISDISLKRNFERYKVYNWFIIKAVPCHNGW